MKKLFSLMYLAVAVISIVSCQMKEIEEINTSLKQNVVRNDASVLFATFDQSAQSRVSMVDRGAEGLSFAWERTDHLTLECDEVTYTYSCADAESGAFVCNQKPDFQEGTEYTVYFGKNSSPRSSQNNSDNRFGDGDKTLTLRALFTYYEGEPINLQFEGVHPIITIVCRDFDTENYKSDYMVFCNGDAEHSYISHGCVVDDEGTLTTSLVIDANATPRDLIFKFEGKERKEDGNLNVLSYHVRTSKEYKAGVRYMADITDLPHYEANCYAYSVKQIQEGDASLHTENCTFLITDEEIEYGALSGIISTETSDNYPLTFNNIGIIMPNATTLEKSGNKYSSVFYHCDAISSIYAPKLVDVGYDAFAYCSAMRSFEAPLLELNNKNSDMGLFKKCEALTSVKVKSIDKVFYWLFSYCYALTDVDLSEVTVLETQSLNDTAFVNLSLPKATTLNSQSLESCANLESVELPVADTFAGNVFNMCDKLRTIKLTSPELITLNDTTFGNLKTEECHLYLSPANYANVTNGNKWGGEIWQEISVETI